VLHAPKSHSSRFNHPNNIGWVQIINRIIIIIIIIYIFTCIKLNKLQKDRRECKK
jgi:hypothetical protein